ncbi:MAG: formylmethanofuran dehydrogenase subunit E family protein [Candidatus Micrarchaeota archaeon]
MESLLEQLKRFHGHLGPYAVVGFRMGKLASEELGVKGKGLRALVKTGGKPPLSCIIDGIQFSSSCTLGKGNIEVSAEGRAEAVFSVNGKKLEIKLRDSVKKRIDENTTHENEEEIALEIWEMEKEKLFEVRA